MSNTTIETLQQAQHLLRWTNFGECRTYPGPVLDPRKALINRLREGQAHDYTSGNLLDMSGVMDDAADMLEADEQLREMLAADNTEDALAMVPMTDEEIIQTGHRMASKYTHRSDPTSHAYGFVKHTLIAFVRAVEAHHGIK
jgi:hypothetical protein